MVCSVCQKKNFPGAATCAWCGSPLQVTTFKVPNLDDIIGVTPPTTQDLPRQDTLSAGTLAIYVGGMSHPIIIQSRGKVILGRYTPGEPPPTVDLSQYDAQHKGVSRQHAAVKFSYGNWVIEDLNSTNGTWLDDVQLQAHQPRELQNGAQVRLGQLTMFVYFSRT